MSHTSAHQILRRDMKLKKLAPKNVPRVLTDRQKRLRMNICRQNLTKLRTDRSLFSRIIATDESWMYTFDPRTKQVDMQWVGSQDCRPRKALRSRSQARTMLILYFDCNGLILPYFKDAGTVTRVSYIDSCVRQCAGNGREGRSCKTSFCFRIMPLRIHVMTQSGIWHLLAWKCGATLLTAQTCHRVTFGLSPS